MSKVSASSSHMSDRAQNRSTMPATTATTAPATIRRTNHTEATHGVSGSRGPVAAGVSPGRGLTAGTAGAVGTTGAPGLVVAGISGTTGVVVAGISGTTGVVVAAVAPGPADRGSAAGSRSTPEVSTVSMAAW